MVNEDEMCFEAGLVMKFEGEEKIEGEQKAQAEVIELGKSEHQRGESPEDFANRIQAAYSEILKKIEETAATHLGPLECNLTFGFQIKKVGEEDPKYSDGTSVENNTVDAFKLQVEAHYDREKVRQALGLR